jgi:hypothetical protein
MPECKVTCYTCRSDTNQPKVWRWLCEDCAADCLDGHRRSTGHTDLNLAVVTAPTISGLGSQIRQAHRQVVQMGW